MEKTNGTVTSEKHLVWDGMAILEERDASNTVIKRYFPEGQLEGTSYFYTRDHLGSVREVTTAAVQSSTVTSTMPMAGRLQFIRAPTAKATSATLVIITTLQARWRLRPIDPMMRK